jgi:pimeloyl-ACP methyl ester carboxylesterase
MPAITPFDLDPANSGIDRFTAYWYATLCKLVYQPATWPRAAVWALGGATAVQTVGITGTIIPSCDVGLFPANRAVCAFRGTTSAIEGALQIVGATLFPRAPWAGFVGNYHSAITELTASFVFPVLTAAGVTNVAWCGHSLGGSVAVLIADLVIDQAVALTDCICTLAAPRSGNLTFATSQTYRHLRLTNAGDAIPMLPPSTNSVMDVFLWLPAPIPLTSFWHAGTRCHLFYDGSAAFPPDQSTWADGSAILLNVANDAERWLQSHSTDEYARRVRIGIPVDFNVVDAAWPGLKELDQWWADANATPPAGTWLERVFCP